MKSVGKVVAITGGASGIGLAFAHRWVAEGGKVVLLDKSEDALKLAPSALNPDSFRPVLCDVAARGSVDNAINSIKTNEGHLDALLNGAGIIIPLPTAEVSDEDFERVVNIHVFGALRTSRAAYPLLKESKGAIVNISSIAAVVGMPKRASYCTAKSGIEGLTRSLAVEWAPDDIRVNAVAPGFTKTDMTGNLIRQGKLNVEKIEARTPMRRFAQPNEIASAIAFLFSDDASYITGHSLVVDGGMTIDANWY